MLSLSMALSLCLFTDAQPEAQPDIVNQLFEPNRWWTLGCESAARWNCSWEVRRDGTSPFQPVKMGTEFVRTPLTRERLPGDVEVYLNAITKGTYRCSCRENDGQIPELQKEVYFYSEGKCGVSPLIEQCLLIETCAVSIYLGTASA